MRPPKLAETILKLIFPDQKGLYTTLGDIEEAFHCIQDDNGIIAAYFWYWWVVLRSIPIYINRVFYGGIIMFRNYLKIAWRNIVRQKSYSILNISGLSIGMAIFLLIISYVQFEMSFDSFHENGNDIYRVIREKQLGNYTDRRAMIGAPLAPMLQDQFPQVKSAVRLTKQFEGLLVMVLTSSKLINSSLQMKLCLTYLLSR